MLIALSNKNDLRPLVESIGMDASDAKILFEKMLAYLIKEEYAVTKLPRDIAETYGSFLDMIEKDGKHIKRK